MRISDWSSDVCSSDLTGTVLRASYGEGFKAPGLYQLFSEYGNVGLDPEEAHGWEAGVEQHLLDSKLVVGATWFDRTTKNQIIYNGCSSPTTDPLCTVPGRDRKRTRLNSSTQCATRMPTSD